MQKSQISIFQNIPPLAFRLRPKKFEEIVGQEHLKESGVLKYWLEKKLPYSLILWGPPGCGKTTIASIGREYCNKEFIYLSGANATIADLRDVIKKADNLPGQVVLFVDEIHRLAKNQQDIFLEPLESGNLILIGSTTENPHISITRALHSRVKILELKPLTNDDLKKVIDRAFQNDSYLAGYSIEIEVINSLIVNSSGDTRRLLFNLEMALSVAKKENKKNIDKQTVENILKGSQLQIGSDSNNHYHYVSALQKSIRGSDPDAAVYWLARLLSGGADPVHVARRILVTASEDIGLANSNALNVALNAYQVAMYIGMPEARIALSQAVIYLSCASKSNSAYNAINSAIKDASELTPYSVPIHIRNLDGEGYKYPHDYQGARVDQEYLPKELLNKKYYIPNDRDETI